MSEMQIGHAQCTQYRVASKISIGPQKHQIQYSGLFSWVGIFVKSWKRFPELNFVVQWCNFDRETTQVH